LGPSVKPSTDTRKAEIIFLPISLLLMCVKG
jgi:hypothetical protein